MIFDPSGANFMATASITRRRSRVRLWTIADLAALPEELPTGPARYELDNGELIIMPPPGDSHGAIESNIGAELKIQGERRRLGKARTEVGVILRRRPDRVVAPDALFIANTSLPIKTSPEGYLETIPDLAVEIRSKNDTLAEMLAKVRELLKAGVRVVWLVDPQARTVTAYRRGRKPKVFSEADTLTIEDVIPGFQMSVADVFEE
jgi:Uma2 family endonuclease